MTQEQSKRKPRAAPDEGAAYTKALMTEVKRLRLSKVPTWSAERLAEEMTAAGVPWTRDTVTNLETGRRKWIAAHEVLALAFVLGVSDPVELIVPQPDKRDFMIPVTPSTLAPVGYVRAWLRGETGPLRDALDESTNEASKAVADWLADAPEAVRREFLDIVRAGRLITGRRPEAGHGES